MRLFTYLFKFTIKIIKMAQYDVPFNSNYLETGIEYEKLVLNLGQGGLFVGNADGKLSVLPKGTTGQWLKMGEGGVPSWAALANEPVTGMQVFMGTLGPSGTIEALPETYNKGETWRIVGVDGTSYVYAGKTYEPGDWISAINDGEEVGIPIAADWAGWPDNLTYAVTFKGSEGIPTADHITVATGTGWQIKSGGKKISDLVQKSDFDSKSVIISDAAGQTESLTMGVGTILGRKVGAPTVKITALTASEVKTILGLTETAIWVAAPSNPNDSANLALGNMAQDGKHIYAVVQTGTAPTVLKWAQIPAATVGWINL